MEFKNIFRMATKKRTPFNAKHGNLKGATVFPFSDSSHSGLFDKSYANMSLNGFEHNIIAYRCIRMISEAGAFVPVRLYENGEELVDHPILDLLQNPNKEQTFADLLEEFYAYLQISGNAYLEFSGTDIETGALYSLRPDRMRVTLDEQGWPQGYEYRIEGKVTKYTIPTHGISPVLHHRLFHPTSDHYGLSPLTAASKSIDVHNSAGAWNKSLFDNLARPSGALLYQGPEGMPNMTEEQFEHLKSELEQNYQGAQNAGRPMLLEGGLSWLPLSLSPQDMDFIEAKNLAAREVALAFGVPPMLLGIPGDNTYANYSEANRAFWRQTVLPMVQRGTRALGKWLNGVEKKKLYLNPDVNLIPALADERSRLWERVGGADFLTINEKRQALGYGVIEDGDRLERRRKEKNEN